MEGSASRSGSLNSKFASTYTLVPFFRLERNLLPDSLKQRILWNVTKAGGRSARQRVSKSIKSGKLCFGYLRWSQVVDYFWSKQYNLQASSYECLYSAEWFNKRVPDKFLVVSCKFCFRIFSQISNECKFRKIARTRP